MIERLGDDLLALETKQQDERGQQRDQRYRLQRAPAVSSGPPGRLLRSDMRRTIWARITGHDDIEPHGKQQRFPGHGDRREAEQQADDRGEGEDHDRVVQGDLLSVKCGSPSERLLQTNTIAVQGAAASRIRPAI